MAEGVWTEAVISPAGVLNAVAYENRISAWAAGNLGVVFHFKGSAWEVYPSGTDQDLYGVAVSGGGQAWAVGAGGAIVHFDGNSWDLDPQSGAVTMQDLHAVAFLNESNGWVAGSGVVLHYDGTSWTKVLVTTRTLNGIAASSEDYIWFCGNEGALILFDGTTFTPYVVGAADWKGISFPYRRLGWAVGTGGAIARFNPGKYTADPHWGLVSSPTALDLSGICVLPDPEWGYAVGAGGMRLALADNGDWKVEASGGGDLRDVDLPNRMEGAAVGGSGTARIVMVRAKTTEKDLFQVRVFPNPYDPGEGGVLTFDRLPANVKSIEIITLRGEEVGSLGHGIEYDSATGMAFWRGANRRGKTVAAGPYLFRVSAPGVKDRKGTILVVKR